MEVGDRDGPGDGYRITLFEMSDRHCFAPCRLRDCYGFTFSGLGYCYGFRFSRLGDCYGFALCDLGDGYGIAFLQLRESSSDGFCDDKHITFLFRSRYKDSRDEEKKEGKKSHGCSPV